MIQARGHHRTKLRMGVGKLRRREDIEPTGKKVLEKFHQVVPDLGKLLEYEVYAMGESISIIKGRFAAAGWCLVITHQKRWPSWSELAEARHRLIDASVDMAIPFPSDEKYIPLHENTIILFEVQTRTSRIITEAPDVSILRDR